MSAYSLCWLDYTNAYCKQGFYTKYKEQVLHDIRGYWVDPAVKDTAPRIEIQRFFQEYFDVSIPELKEYHEHSLVCSLNDVAEAGKAVLKNESFSINYIQDKHILMIIGGSESGLLYGLFYLFSILQQQKDYTTITVQEGPKNPLRLLNHWDNLDGTIERGYSGTSIFFNDNRIINDPERHQEYARLLASVGINGTVINNVNVKNRSPFLITDSYLPDLARLAAILRSYHIRLYLSVNFMSPVIVGGLETADPLDPQVISWWQAQVGLIYKWIPDFGGFLVKADSEYNPGPHTYGRSQSDGANMLARVLQPYGGVLIWRAFVYMLQDWRDTNIDRARAAYDIFRPLDGQFEDNVILQIKNGPHDFQVREPVSPLFGTMAKTNQILELQITQEYTGHQIDLCYLAPQWKQVLDFDPHISEKNVKLSSIINGDFYKRPAGGMAGVSNIGNDYNWTGHWLAQANWYAFGKLAWNPDLASEEIAREWILRSLTNEPSAVDTIVTILERSWPIYEKYTTPFGLGWMVTPGTHYGPNPEGYEYSIWGTYHRADTKEIGVDRTSRGTGFSGQYSGYWKRIFDDRDLCPETLILFFHRLPYTYVMKNGKTLLQNYYDAHFQGYEEMRDLQQQWQSVEHAIEPRIFAEVSERFVKQEENARQWRDVINSYFYRRTGIKDEMGRPLY